ncbi:MAG: glycosyltransferase [Alphaproteobacteria bacterium]|uniref:Glycosyltransferase n=1 Tax=Candidatus Nitrobium versatile TaxID=2884831 RepID=A0A953JDJ0_9BACT|nr:glycosyltransferase [Candidatus Nitrobium versatile]
MKEKLIVAHIIATNFFGGPEKQILEHARRLDPERFSLVLISFVERSLPNELLHKATRMTIPTREFYTGNPYNPRIIFDLASILRRDRIDLLCTHGYKSNIIGRISSHMAGIPEIAVSRGWTGENWKIKLYEELDRIFLRLADHVVAVSEGQREKILQLGIPPERVSVIHNGIHLSCPDPCPSVSLRQELKVDGGECLVMSAGRLSIEKNFGGLIDAAALLAKKEPALRFVVFGEGVLRETLEQKVREAGLQGMFFLPGFRRDFASILLEADIFVLPSFTEGLPNVVLEAYAQKKPVVATAVGGVPEVVRHGTDGFLVRPEETVRMAEYILTLARNPQLREEMGVRGYLHIKEYFNFEIQTRKYEDLYREVYETFHLHRHAGA